MSFNLVIVESPAKAKTIEKYLGKKYKVVSSIGHIRDLPKSKMGIDIENDFEPYYITIRGKGPLLASLKKERKKASKVLIATDPDREGEAIAWHLQQILDIDSNEKMRVSFQEITKKAVNDAVKKPRNIDINLVDAQQARRILDRLVGYTISPILWRKVMKGLSAGRVQSVATRLLIIREREIRAFISKEYWNFFVHFKHDKIKFRGEVTKYNSKKIDVDNEKTALEYKNILNNSNYEINKITKKKRNRKPYLPYTTSTLQQDASIRLGFSAAKTMMNAQKLYEGKRVKGGTQGLITYMRTDSTRVSDEALAMCASFIEEEYGKNYLNIRKTASSKKSQDAHEAIRPTDINRTPESLTKYLNRDELRLYTAIWQRFVASQMSEAIYDSIKIDVKANKFDIVVKGEILNFDGFIKAYPSAATKDSVLPDLDDEKELNKTKTEAVQKFTQPPARYTEASLIKELEDKGIGRPSTYSPTLSTIMRRGYAIKEKKSLVPTELGEITNTIMEENFLQIVDTDFTANMEKKFDDISDGKLEWKTLIRDFYKDFAKLSQKAEESIKKYDLSEMTDIDCEKCSSKMLIKKTIKGSFYACSNYPDCKNTKPILKEIGIKCPKCEEGQIVERKTKKLRVFYGCSEFPKCRFASWDKPIDKACKKCGSILVEGKGRRKDYIHCSNKECDFEYKKENKE